jgi:hypothetical protein
VPCWPASTLVLFSNGADDGPTEVALGISAGAVEGSRVWGFVPPGPEAAAASCWRNRA